MIETTPRLFVAIPMMDELENLPQLLSCLKNQTFSNFATIFCVNQPEDYWQNHEKLVIAENNLKTIEILEKEDILDIIIIDKSSKGNGWLGKLHGVGAARATIFNQIRTISSQNDLVVSMDGDTTFDEKYLEKIVEKFNTSTHIPAISIPYYHNLTGDEDLDRAMLRYEIYMRHYYLNLVRIGSPYSFTALGSAIAFRMEDYMKIGGMTPKLSGEDFYFLQKMAKYKTIANHVESCVYPAARYSDRVFFGTGPAIIKGAAGDWSSYPIYQHESFDELEKFFSLIPSLFFEEVETPVDDFVSKTGNKNWQKLRLNAKTVGQFTKLVHQNFDGLRTLQYLKANHALPQESDSQLITRYLKKYHPDFQMPIDFSLESSIIHDLNLTRDFLFTEEMKARKKWDEKHF